MTEVALLASSTAWYAIKAVLADELWFFSFGLTVWYCLPFVIPLMLKRGSSIGQNTTMWWAYIGMAITWWAAVYPLDPFFQSAPWLALGVLTVGWALAVIYTVRKIPAQPLAQTASSS